MNSFLGFTAELSLRAIHSRYLYFFNLSLTPYLRAIYLLLYPWCNLVLWIFRIFTINASLVKLVEVSFGSLNLKTFWGILISSVHFLAPT